jgi:hypothetical protein
MPKDMDKEQKLRALFERMKEADWRVATYPSGSIVVSARGVEHGAHYRINHPRHRDDLADRYATAKALEAWLNGGSRSDLLELMVRTKPNEVLLQSGIPVEAATRTSHPDAKIMAWRLIDGLVNGEVPEV